MISANRVRTLKHFDSADDPTQAKKIIYDGLGLTDFVVLPHWGSGEFGEILKTTKVELQKEYYTRRKGINCIKMNE